MLKKLLLGVGLLSGTIIGAGVFSLPYVFYQSGWLIGATYLFVFAFLVALVHIMYAEVVESTPGEHRLVGFSGIYLGKAWETVAAIISPVGLLFTLTAYLVLGERFLLFLFPDGLSLAALLTVWLVSTLLIFWKTERLGLAGAIKVASIATVVFIIFFYGIREPATVFNFPAINGNFVFLPYGAVLFSLWGRTAVPPLVRYFRDGKIIRLVKPAIVLAITVPVLLYAVFIVGVVRLAAPYVAEDAISGLAAVLPAGTVWIVGVLGLLAILTPYAVVGKNVYQTLVLDAGWKPYLGAVFVALTPLALYFLGLKDFIGLVSVIGGAFLSTEGILMVSLWRKVKLERGSWRSWYGVLTYPLLAVFAGGIIYALVYH